VRNGDAEVTAMSPVSPLLLIAAVCAVGVFHTMVPDHWAPIALLARQQGWSRATAIRAAAGAGFGHTVSTLIIAVIVWVAGTVLAQRFGHLVQLASSAALVGFGLWIAGSALRELRSHHAHFGHMHWHAHAPGQPPHRHWHEHHDEHLEPLHDAIEHAHEHPKASTKMTLLLILGSSPMIEGIPAFFAASGYGVWQLAIMSVAFAVSTIATYVALVALSVSGLERVSLGRFERYGEVVSGISVALIGAVFFVI
jgi:ABC-type nickel/cobalt efflux system permease component RcnA